MYYVLGKQEETNESENMSQDHDDTIHQAKAYYQIPTKNICDGWTDTQKEGWMEERKDGQK